MALEAGLDGGLAAVEAVDLGGASSGGSVELSMEISGSNLARGSLLVFWTHGASVSPPPPPIEESLPGSYHDCNTKWTYICNRFKIKIVWFFRSN